MIPISGSHGKVGTIYYFYSIWLIGEDKYELTIELNHKVVKQKTANDDRCLRTYAMGYIDGLEKGYNKGYGDGENDGYKYR